MYALIVGVILAIAFALFAVQNNSPVDFRYLGYSFQGIPLYLLVIISFFFGLLIAWGLSLIGAVGSALTIFGKNSKIKQKDSAIGKLESRIHDLEVENASLKAEKSP